MKHISDYELHDTSVPLTLTELGADIDGLVSLITVQGVWCRDVIYRKDSTVVIRYSATRFVEYVSLISDNVGNDPVCSPEYWLETYDNNVQTSGYFGEILNYKCATDKGVWVDTAVYSKDDMVVIADVDRGGTLGKLTSYVARISNIGVHPSDNPDVWELRTALPTGASLAGMLGLAHTDSDKLINTNSGWLKFAHGGQIKYIAKRPFMHSVTWDDIANADAVFGDNMIRIGEHQFRVSIMTGTASAGTSEWDELMYRVHNRVPIEPDKKFRGAAQVGSNWWNFTDWDIAVGTGLGRYTWCKDTCLEDDTRRVGRGGEALEYLGTAVTRYSSPFCGWRPCLTLVS